MTTSDMFSGAPTSTPTSGRLLRRNRTNRVAAGVSSGLGEYFGVDPVLFRVLFATAAFFGGAGILAYLLAWAAIPETGTAHAPIDGFIAWVKRRRVPLWIVAVLAGLFIWAVAFSWWSPGPFFPVIAVVVLLVVIFTRRELQASAPTGVTDAPPGDGAAPPPAVDLTKDETTPGPATPAAEGQPTWMNDARSWFDEAREASRRRRRRSLPLRIAIIVALATTLTALGIADAVTGIDFQTYFWVILGIVGGGLLVGLVMRRTPISMLPLLLLGGAGAIAFGGSHFSLHDGVGQRIWDPTTAPAAEYRLAFGQGVLDLRDLGEQTTPTTIDVTMGAGQLKVLTNSDQNVIVETDIHFGQLTADGSEVGPTEGGVGIQRTVDAPAGAAGAPITVHVQLADGNVTILHHI